MQALSEFFYHIKEKGRLKHVYSKLNGRAGEFPQKKKWKTKNFLKSRRRILDDENF